MRVCCRGSDKNTIIALADNEVIKFPFAYFYNCFSDLREIVEGVTFKSNRQATAPTCFLDAKILCPVETFLFFRDMTVIKLVKRFCVDPNILPSK